MNKEQILGVVRHVLTAGSGAIAGWLHAAQDDVTAAIAALVTLVGFIWSVMAPEKKKDPATQ